MEFVQYLYTNSIINKNQFIELKQNKTRKIGDLLISKKILSRDQVLKHILTFSQNN